MTSTGPHSAADLAHEPRDETPVERLALERRIAELERERGELWVWVEHLERLAECGLHARGLAHDLGNALTAILTRSELAAIQSDPDEHRHTVEANLESSRKAAERLHTYIAFSRRDDATLGPVHVREVLADAARFLAYPLRKAEMTVEATGEESSRVHITHPRLLQVLTHALLTLVKGATRPGGRITIVERCDGRMVTVDLRRIAPPPSDEPTNDAWRVGSTGFELHLAREILERSGGRILGEPSDGLTGTIRIVLPVALDDEARQPRLHGGGAATEHGPTPTAWRAWSGGWVRG